MREWAGERVRDVRDSGMAGVVRTRHDLTEYALRATLGRHRSGWGTPIYEREWDLLVVLDGCRLDLFREVAPEYPFATPVGSTRSVGSHSEAWMTGNFGPSYDDELARTAYVTGNPFSARNLEPARFGLLDEVWRYAWDDSQLQTVRARPITDRTVAAGRDGSYDRIIAHYMQPHASFVPRPAVQPTVAERSIWMDIAHGAIDRETVWDAYRANLRYVLDDVRTLLENVDADRVVVTSDHGNAIGEWGIYGHPGVPLEVLRRVPWVETEATDTGSFQPSIEPAHDDQANAADRLADLGYIERQRGD